jgi:Delta7-sterol 5-desaturase
MITSDLLLIIFVIGAPVMVGVGWGFYAMLSRLNKCHKIYDIPVSKKQKRQELSHFIPVVVVHTVIAAFFVFSGLLPIVLSVNVWHLLASIVVALVVQEGWYYTSHYLMHQSKLLWKAHKPHHRSMICTGFTGVSFSAAEKFIFSGGIFVIYSLLAHFLYLSFEGIAFAYLVYFLFAASGHFNQESYPANFVNIPVLKYLTTATYHSFHHTYPATNFGLYTRILDVLFKTDHPDYNRLYQKSARESGLKAVREPS